MNAIKTFCLILLLIANLSAPAEASSFDAGRSGTGRAKIASGIVLTSVLSAVGAIGLMTYGMGLCGSDSYDGCPKDFLLGSTAAIGVGLGLGIPLIVSGARDRKAWKSQNRAQARESEHNTSSFGVDVFVTQKKLGLLRFTYDL